jgi:hypothetical protein
VKKEEKEEKEEHSQASFLLIFNWSENVGSKLRKLEISSSFFTSPCFTNYGINASYYS